MPTFAYQARDKTGRKVAGTRDASDHHSALSDLREQGLFVTQLAPVGRVVGLNGNGAAAPTIVTNGVAANGVAAEATAPVGMTRQVAAPADPPAPSHTITAPGREDILTCRPAPAVFRAAPQSLGAPLSGEARQRREARQSAVSAPAPATPAAPAPSAAQRPPSIAGDATSAPPRTMGPLVPQAPPSQPWMRANAKEMALFFRQMHAMINAGTTVGQALNSLSENAINPALRQASKDMSVRTAHGRLWSETMRTYPGLFSELMVGMISAGEMGGFLDRMCQRLAEYSERDYEIQQAIKRETWYPKLLVVMSILIPSAVPAVLAIVQPGHVSPLVAWLQNVTPPFLVVGAAYGFWKCQDRILPVATHSGSPRYLLDMVKLTIPIAGKTTRALATAKFCRALGAMQAAGAGLNQTITMAANACGNAVIAEHAKSIIPRVERGEGLTDSLASTGYFPGIALQMLRTGEESGSIELQLEKVADFLEADAETTIKQSVQVLGIVVFLLIAIRIGIQIVQFYMGYADSLGSLEQ